MSDIQCWPKKKPLNQWTTVLRNNQRRKGNWWHVRKGLLLLGTGNLTQKAASGHITKANIDILKGFMSQDKNHDTVFPAILREFIFSNN